MKLHSVTDHTLTATFVEAVDRGIAEDGGLFIPDRLPMIDRNFLESSRSLSFQEIASRLAVLLLRDEIPEHDLGKIVQNSLTFPVPLHALDDRTSVLELFHGPTLAFKDFGARFMARTLAYLHRNRSRELTILVATSGDTGSAVASGFLNVEGMNVVLLYPSGRVSSIQEKQLTTVGGNVTALEVDGAFDDCQRLVKQAFADTELRSRKRLTSANSINIARLIPQAFYYFHAYARMPESSGPIVFSVPSGNLGNLTAGLLAAEMGLPVDRFIAATNANAVVPQFLETGLYTPRPAVKTISNAMDVGNPSNFARINALCGENVEHLRRVLYAASFTDEETRREMDDVFSTSDYILDPHGAVASLALRKYRNSSHAWASGVILETAHPAKFLDVYTGSILEAIEVPESLRISMQGTKRSIRIASRYNDFRSFLLSM